MTARVFLASLLIAGLIVAPAASANPVAEAHGNEFLTRYVRVGSTVELDGAHSYGADCTLTYAWNMVSRPSGSSAAISSPGSAQPTFVPDRVGDYVIDLIVGDSSGTSNPARITVSAITGSQFPLPAKNADRWMTLTPKIMDRTLPQISLPGTHDSGAYWLDACDDENCRGPDFVVWWDAGEWLLSDQFENDLAYELAHAHAQTIFQQLIGGVRSFDLRVTRHGDAFYVYHGLLGRPLAEVLQQFRSLMDGAEHELVQISISHLKTGSNSGNAKEFTPEQHRLLMQELVDALGPYLYARDGRTMTDLRATRLGQIVADGPKILLFYEFGTAKEDPDCEYCERFWEGTYITGGGYTDTIKMFDSESCPRPVGIASGDLGQFTDQKCKATLHAARGDLTGFVLNQTLTANWQIGALAGTCKASREWWWLPPLIRLGWSASCNEPRSLLDLSRVVNPHLPAMLDAIAPVRPSLIKGDFYEESALVSEAIRLNQYDSTAPTSSAARNPPPNRYGGSFGDVTVTLIATDETGGSGVEGMRVVTEGAQASSSETCGARAEILVRAKGVTTVRYQAWDREGNTGPWQSLVLRNDQKCDFNRDGKADAADRSGLARSLSDKSIQFLGDLDEDGRYTSQEWIRCWYHLYKGDPL
jgi:hypothetical protein